MQGAQDLNESKLNFDGPSSIFCSGSYLLNVLSTHQKTKYILSFGVAVHRGVMMADTLSFNAKIGLVDF